MLAKLQAFMQEAGFERTYWLAYSGGLDSQVLLRLCVELRKQQPFTLRAIHIHHGLSPLADHWLSHCQQSCELDQVEFFCQRITVLPPPGKSLEATAREQRYGALSKVLHPGDVLLTAHHQDDQAETVLLQLLRGAGPKGLSAMPQLKALGEAWLGRPLLDVTRLEMRVYAESQGLLWVEDELNQDLHYPRNRLRHELLPLLRQNWPSATQTLARSAELCAEAQALLDEYADGDLARVSGVHNHRLSVKRLLELSPARQRLILRRWFESQGVLMPNATKLCQVQQAVLQASLDGQPCVAWGGVELRRYQDELYLLHPKAPHEVACVYHWDLQKPLLLAGIGSLHARSVIGQGLQSHLQEVEVRFRQGGEVYLLPNGKHHELKKFFQEQAIPLWERDRLPLLYSGGELIAIPGYFVIKPFQAQRDEVGFVVEINYTNP